MNQAKQSRIEFETLEYILPAIEEIAKVSAKGFAKYGAENWARASRCQRERKTKTTWRMRAPG